MKNIQRAVIIGAIAGTIDIIPMIFQGLCWYANSSAFVFWVSMGIIIPSINWNLKSWIKGLVVAELSALPIMIIIAKTDINSLIPISIMSAILGSLVGHFSNKYVAHEN